MNRNQSTILATLLMLAAQQGLAQDIQVSSDWGDVTSQPAATSDDDLTGNSAEEDALLQALYNEEEDEDLNRMLQSEDYIFPSSITDNWHLLFQLGDNTSWGSYSEKANFFKLSNFAAGFGIGKYLTPVNDVRVHILYGRNTTVRGPRMEVDDWAGTLSPDLTYDYKRYNFNTLMFSAAWLPNFTNLVYGYEPERRFTFSGLMGIGIERTWGYTRKDLSVVSVWAEESKAGVPRTLVGLQFGIQFDYMLNDRWHLNLEATDTFLDDAYDGLISDQNWDGHYNVLLGVSWFLKGKMNNGRIQNRNPFADKYQNYEERIYKNREAIEDALANKKPVIETVEVTKDVLYTLIAFDEHIIEVPRLQQNNVYTTAEAYKSIPQSKIFITNSNKLDDKLFHERAWSISKLLHNRWQVPLEDIWVDADESHIQAMQLPEVKHYIILIVND